MRNERRMELLIVDDDLMIRIDMADRLERRGFGVFRAANADQAIRILERHPSVGAVLTDLKMPGSMNGLGLLRAVAQRWPGCRLVLISGMGSPPPAEIPRHALFLSKPVSRRDLDEALTVLQAEVVGP